MAVADEENPAAGSAAAVAELVAACGRAVELNPDNSDAADELQRAQQAAAEL
jgi:hypothetical protein